MENHLQLTKGNGKDQWKFKTQFKCVLIYYAWISVNKKNNIGLVNNNETDIIENIEYQLSFPLKRESTL
jgi:hypothetical protein